MRVLEYNDFLNIISGSSFFGGGGGGAALEGLDLLHTLKKEEQRLELYDISEMTDDPNVVSTMVAALGSPIATKGRLFEEESVHAVQAMMAEAKSQGKSLAYMYSGEQGGGNTMLPLYAAIKLGLPVLDLDGNGRAVPELGTGLQAIHDIPTSPMVLASGKGDTITGRTQDPLDSKACETIARQMCQAYGMGIGFCAWMMNKEDHLRSSAIGQLTKTLEVGKILNENSLPKAIKKLQEYLGEPIFNVLGTGVIQDIEMDTSGGFDTGMIAIKASDGVSGQYKVLFQNENLVAYGTDGTTLATVPGIISILHGEENRTVALSNSEIEIGDTVVVTKTTADPHWYEADGRGYSCWNDVLVSAGYCKVNPEVR